MQRLEAQSLSFGYPTRQVGRNANLSVSAGETLCLLGPNGCGKTTLFKTLLGLLSPQGGRVLFGDDDIATLSRDEIARRAAYVPQGQNAPFPYTSFDMVLMGRVAHRGLFAGPSKKDRDLAMQALDELGVAPLADREFTTLSGGQRQLVIVARALAQASPFIVLDEPTASLDFGNQVVVLSTVKALAQKGAAIVLSTHDPNHAFAIGTKVALMREGTIVASGPPDEVLTPSMLQTVYGVPVAVEKLPAGRTVCVPDYR